MIGPATYNAEVEWAIQVVNLAKQNLIRGKKIAAGTLYNSVEYEVNRSTGEIDFYYADEGVFVESGRRAGAKMPPPKAIAKWAKIKGIPQFRDKKGRYISNDSRAFLLGRSIAEKGIKPFPFFTDALEQATQQLYNDLEDALVEDLENSIDQSLGGSQPTHMNF
jgi:hypothetical protein